MTYILLLPFALAPSLLWLAFYLRKDAHPEPNRMILKIFLAGMLITIPALYLETFLKSFLLSLNLSHVAFLLVYFFFVVALVEELLKYLVVRMGVYANSALDEPLDLVLYMIIAALGFAAFENILLLFGLVQFYSLSDIFLVNMVRFVQAILLHALASGLLGYFLVRALLAKKQKAAFLFLGFSFATLLHGIFNFYIFTIGGKNIFLLLLPILVLAAIAVFISFEFRKLKYYGTKNFN